MYLVSRPLVSICLLLVGWTGVYASGKTPPTSTIDRNSVQAQFSQFVWYGMGPDGKTGMMLVASIQGQFMPTMLTVYTLKSQGCPQPVRLCELNGPSVFKLVGLKVYRDPKRRVLYAALTEAGAAPLGDWVVAIDSSGNPQTLFSDLNRGEPTLRISNGVPEIRELWPVFRLMDTGWRPTKEFDGHVLVERIYRLGPKGKFESRIVRPAMAVEKKLSKREFRQLLKARQDFESRHQRSDLERK